MNPADQIFVMLKHWAVQLAPVSARPLLSMIVDIVTIMALFGTCFAVVTLVERKLLGRIQNRFGPNRVGPWGILQPMADGVKMLTKEDIVPANADHVVHFLAPFVLTVPAWLGFAAIPFGRNMAAIDLDSGALFLIALGAASELAVFMAGWSSRNKYSLFGAMRSIAQMISYETPLILAIVPVLMLTGTLSLNEIVAAQANGWNVFTPWGLAGFVIFMIAAASECNRSPFDLPEAESEIVAGYLTEYSGFKYALFFLGEYLGWFVSSGFAVTLFLGGWQAPFAALSWLPSWGLFFFKFALIVLFFIWLRGTVPRLRLDQLLGISWKALTPLALINLCAAALWHFTRIWTFAGALELRWVMGALLIGVPAWLLVRLLTAGLSEQREYSYAA
jgi:NADH-quinone oxidoreductase subunit H